MKWERKCPLEIQNAPKTRYPELKPGDVKKNQGLKYLKPKRGLNAINHQVSCFSGRNNQFKEDIDGVDMIQVLSGDIGSSQIGVIRVTGILLDTKKTRLGGII